MKEDMYIKRRDKEDKLYQRLQAEALEMLKQLSGRRWTDFNEHDPGITVLDILHYALLEFEYVFETPFEAFLAEPDTKELVYRKVGLLPPEEIFEPAIVTPSDYEALFRTIPGVKDCLVQPDSSSSYIFFIEKEEAVDEDSLREEVLACYHAHRNLCENVGSIIFGKITAPGLYPGPQRNKQVPALDVGSQNNHPYPHLSGEGKTSALLRSRVKPGSKDVSIPLRKSVTPNRFVYNTLQNEFPECYGIGERGLSSNTSIERKSEALQLKGYLLIFDYLLSGVSQQLKEIHSLLELSGKLPAKFRAAMDIPEIGKLLDKEKLKQSVIFDPEEVVKQKNRFFDWLDIFYGEDTACYPAGESLAFRARLIERFPLFNTLRLRSFNLQDRDMRSMPGIKLLLHALLGNEQEYEMSVINNFSRYNLKLITDQRFFRELQENHSIRFFLGEYDRIPQSYEIDPVPRIAVDHSLPKFYKLRDQLNLLWSQVLFEGFLKSGMEPDNYRSIWLPDKSGYLLLYKHPGQEEWLNMGFFFEKERLIETCNRLWAFIEKLNRESFTCYFVEHLLLLDNESNALTIVLTGWVEHFYPRESYLPVLEERLPAHLDIHYKWLGVEEMKLFEEHYFQWRSAWAYNDPESISRTSAELKKLITPKTDA